MDNLSFRAQSLDNQTTDPMEVNRYFLAEDDVTERQDLAQKISEVSSNGTNSFPEGSHTAFRSFPEGSHTAFLYGDKFLLKTPSDQLDNAGRIAPLLCYGHVPDDPSESWSDDVVNAMVGFAERIGRTISDDSQKVARHYVVAILETKKRIRRRRQMVRGAVVVLIVLAVLGIIYEILFRK